MVKYSLHLFLGCIIFSVPMVNADNSRIYFNGQDLFLNGLNLAWQYFANDIGPSSYSPDLAHFETVFSQLEAHGANCMRLWLHTNGAHTPAWNGFTVTGPGVNTISDLEAILDLAWEHNISLMLCLWSFDMLRESYGTTITDRSMAILTNPSYRQSYINNSLIPMATALRGHPAILAWEIFNEPEGMSFEFGWSGIRRVSMANIQAFVNLCAGAIHRADPTVRVTNGCWDMQAGTDVDGHTNYYTDSRLIAAGNDPDGTLDFYCIHYYDWAKDSHSPFLHPASYWGLDKPLVIAEFYPNCVYCTSASYETLYQNGYAGALAWSWTDTVPQSQMLDHILAVSSAHRDDILIYKEGAPVPPVCTITWPLDQIRIPANATLIIRADATDTYGAIEKVEFFQGSEKLGEITQAPYELTWSDIPEGSYVLSAKAANSYGLLDVSAAVTLIAGGSANPQITRYEAENAIYSGAISVQSSANASGGKYLNMTNPGVITWDITMPSAGSYDLVFGYNLHYDTPKTQYLKINDNPSFEVEFTAAQTGTWLEKTIPVYLNAGSNQIKIESYWGWMFFDYIQIESLALCAEGDLNLDCQVNMNDLLILAAGWLNPYDLKDLADLSKDWNF